MGCGLRFVRAAPFRLRPDALFRVSLRTVVGAGVHGPDLFGERVMEYQWRFAQPHPQPVL